MRWQEERTQNHYHNIHFGIEIAHSAFEFDLFSCAIFRFPLSFSTDWVCVCGRARESQPRSFIHSFALIQSIVHHYHNKLYEVIYVYADSKISDLLLLQNYLHMHQFNCKHLIPSLSVCSTVMASAKQCAARFQCYFMFKSFKMP